MAGTHPIRNVLRIDNVETVPAERITANDEERQHQGFEIQTVFAWPLRDGALVRDADAFETLVAGLDDTTGLLLTKVV